MGLLDRFASMFSASDGDAAGGRPPPDDDYWFAPYGQPTAAGIRVTPDMAIKATAVFACAKLLAETMAALPLHVYKKLPGDDRELAADHPVEQLISAQANETDTAMDFWTMVVWHASIRGTGYARIFNGARGAVDQLIPLHPDLVRPERYGNPKIPKWRYLYRDPSTGLEETLLQDEILRIPGLITGGVKGMGLCEHADEAIGIGLAADQYAARVFSQNLNMGFIITHPGKLSEQAKDNFIKMYMKRAAGVKNTHRPIILQEGMRVEKMSMTAKDAQLEEARKLQTIEVARRFNIPVHMLGISEGATHSNVEEQSLNFVRYCLLPWGRRIEQACNRDLIIARTTYTIRYNFDGLLRGNSQAQADYFSKALGSGGSPGWMTVNEVRGLVGLNKLAGDEFNTPPIGTNPSNEPKDQVEQKPPQRRLPPPPQEDEEEDDDQARRGRALIRKEIAALRRASMRFAGDMKAWRTYAQSFYGGQVSDVMKRLGVEKDVAVGYCKARTAQCQAGEPASVLEHLERRGIHEVRSLTVLAAA